MFYIQVALAIVGQAFVFQFCSIENHQRTKVLFIFSVLAPFFVVRNCTGVFIGIFFGTFRMFLYFSGIYKRRKQELMDGQLLEALYFDLMAGISPRTSLKKIATSSSANALRAQELSDFVEGKISQDSAGEKQNIDELKLALISIEQHQLRPSIVINSLRMRKKMKEDFRRKSRAMSLNPNLQFSLMSLFFLAVALIFWSQNSTEAPRIVLVGAAIWFFLGGIVFFRLARSFKWTN